MAGFRCVRKHTCTHTKTHTYKAICWHSNTLLHKPSVSAHHVEGSRTKSLRTVSIKKEIEEQTDRRNKATQSVTGGMFLSLLSLTHIFYT